MLLGAEKSHDLHNNSLGFDIRNVHFQSCFSTQQQSVMYINPLTAGVFPVHTDQESVLEGIPRTPTSTLSNTHSF